MSESVAIGMGVSGVIEAAEQPSKTYRLTLDTERIVGKYADGTEVVYHGRIKGYTDGRAAVQQAIRKAIITPRYKCLIYDSQYGSEIEATITANDATREYVIAAIAGFVEDALKPDSRILNVSDFEIEFEKDRAYITFDADTIFGEMEVEEVIGDV